MLVNATEMLIKARDGHYGVPQFNINNLEWTKSVLTACEEMKSPVILRAMCCMCMTWWTSSPRRRKRWQTASRPI